jgi:2-dehydro-3-deoxyphosphogluconate aldolase / (4S)-4-hydroxy-2-oxoglutarate aldolase
MEWRAMNREEVRGKIKEIGIVAAIRVSSKENAMFAAEAVFRGGIPVIEIALTLPGATEVITHLAKQHPQLIVGAGSVLSTEKARASVDAGARFLTSDGLHLPVVEFALKNEIVVFPGALTPSEVINAWDTGCDFVKVVPCAQIGGEAYIRSLHKMYPQISMIAAGGVNQATAARYIVAGAVALGIGSELVPAEAIRNRQEARIHELARRFAGYVRSAREGKLPQREGEFIG